MQIQTIRLNDTATFTLYQRQNIREDQQPLPAVVICPGGGYNHVSKRESEPLALAFLAKGFQAIVLDYTVMEKGTSKNFLGQCLEELQQTFVQIQEQHALWDIDPERIFLLGCSAGGHLAAWYANSKNLIKPKGLLLCYPVTSFTLGWPANDAAFNFKLKHKRQYDTTSMIDATSPATFIWHTADDSVVPVKNSLKYCLRLEKFQVPFEAHLFEHGPHGLSLAAQGSAVSDELVFPAVAKWFDLAIDWLERQI